MQHSNIIGGSTCERRMQCTASAALEASLRPEELPGESAAAAQGTKLHKAMEVALTATDWDQDFLGPTEFLGVTYDEYDNKVSPAYDATMALFDTLDIGFFAAEQTYTHHVTCGPEVFGTTDVIGLSRDGKTALILDYKFGDGIRVEAKENLQLAFYASGAWDCDVDDFEWVTHGECTTDVANAFRDAERVVCAIVQPWRGEDNIVDLWEFPMSWLTESFQPQLKKAYEAITSGKTSYKAGRWCRWCNAKPICPEMKTNLIQIGEIPKPDASMDPVQLAELLDAGARAVEMNKALVEYAQRIAEAGMQIPGRKLVQSFGNRRWADEEAALTAFRRRLAKKYLTDSKLKSPAQLEKVAAKHGVHLDIEGHTTRAETGVKLVDAADKRPAYIPQLGAADITEEEKAKL